MRTLLEEQNWRHPFQEGNPHYQVETIEPFPCHLYIDEGADGETDIRVMIDKSAVDNSREEIIVQHFRKIAGEWEEQSTTTKDFRYDENQRLAQEDIHVEPQPENYQREHFYIGDTDLRSQSTTSSFEYVTSYDHDEGLVVTVTTEHELGNLADGEVRYTYNDSGRVIESEHWRGDERKKIKRFRYTKEGLLKSSELISSEGTSSRIQRYEYEDGRPIEGRTTVDGRTTEIRRFEYECD